MSNLSRKLAEVAAFANLGQELLERGGEAAILAFGDENVESMKDRFKSQFDTVEKDADKPKLERTVAKLRGMMETYIGDSWDDPVELLEWSGFFFGAAQVHWALINNATDDEEVKSFAKQQVRQYNTWLEYACDHIGTH